MTEKQDAGEQHLTLCKRRHGLCVGAGAVQVDIEHAPVLQRRRQHTREHSHLDREASALHGNYELMLCSHFISPFPDQRKSLKLPGICNSGLPGVSPLPPSPPLLLPPDPRSPAPSHHGLLPNTPHQRDALQLPDGIPSAGAGLNLLQDGVKRSDADAARNQQKVAAVAKTANGQQETAIQDEAPPPCTSL